ncbi:MAG: C45 family peptidase, partial [Bryobacteraceae bacterium]
SGKDYAFFRAAAEKRLWPKIEPEYRAELQGIVDGLAAKYVRLDLWDIVVMNASLELNGYYTDWWDSQNRTTHAKNRGVGEHCSAFVATGSYTRDGNIVIGHNNWTNYMDGSRWRIIFDIVPAKGNRILMDGMPGWIHSGDDFGVNSAGIVITETTISRFSGFDPNGIPEFVRARKAMQYSSSIDDFARIMKDGNNGGYANNWLVADRKTGEIADLELGLKNVNLTRTKNGYFVGSNFPVSEKLAKEETEFDLSNKALSPNARRIRAEDLIRTNKGKIDVAFGKKYLSDHWDSFAKKNEPNERTLCGHIDLSPRGDKPWQPEFGTAGTVQNKVTDAAMAGKMTFEAAMGHACGVRFSAADHLKRHPEFAWENSFLRDLVPYPWTSFSSSSF